MVSFAGYPLIVQGRVVGVMAMFARQRLSATTLDTLASVADSIAQGIGWTLYENVVWQGGRMANGQMTKSPVARVFTSEPTSVTTPISSWPMVVPSGVSGAEW